MAEDGLTEGKAFGGDVNLEQVDTTPPDSTINDTADGDITQDSQPNGVGSGSNCQHQQEQQLQRKPRAGTLQFLAPEKEKEKLKGKSHKESALRRNQPQTGPRNGTLRFLKPSDVEKEKEKIAQAKPQLSQAKTAPEANNDVGEVGHDTTPASECCSFPNNGKQQILLSDGAQEPGAYSEAPGMTVQRTNRPRFSLLGVAAPAEPMDDLSSSDASQRSIVLEGENCEDHQPDDNPGSLIYGNANSQTMPRGRSNHEYNAGATTVTDSSNGNENDLAVAELVEADDASKELPQASEFDVGESMRRKEESMKRFKTNMLLLTVFFTTVVLVLVTVLVATKETEEPESLPPVESPNSVSSQPSDVKDSLLAFFPEDTAEAIQRDPLSPQSLAFQWLLDDQDSLSNGPARQRFALVVLYHATNGDSWDNRTHWLNHSIHECDWFSKPSLALKDSALLLYPGFLTEFESSASTCNSDGLYQHLWLDQNNLVGSLPDELYMLTTLRSLSTGLNRLHGTIATLVGKLTKLQHLAIYNQQESGAIPSELGLLTRLRGLGLGKNDHTGMVPTEVWRLTNLETFVATENPGLKGTISTEIGHFSKLRWLLIGDMDLTGTIPTEVGRLTLLEWLVMNGNNLTGSIPSEFGALQDALNMDLSQNLLEGNLPSELGLLTSLTLLMASGNKISGSIPSEYGLLLSLTLALGFQAIWYNTRAASQPGFSAGVTSTAEPALQPCS
ncbi:Leucine Rich Repeat [Seminavis robusta]|uniref:Leucine Rich Repeat n=1 Tax=Seminavis robusta TaxID=568900 RepID=A0A9N8HEJ7_9STRA|nr:Leucine Rich Repeat [Seminavis robusta]|eukprot:Sro519_g158950.1 Leucine Rich Repeat (729) ;mRNA; f:12736-14990